MRKYYLFIVLLMLAGRVHAQWDLLPTATMPSLHDMHFINESVGFMVSEHEIYKTEDGGQSVVSVFTTDLTLSHISFADTQTGIVIGPGYKNIFRTTNQGATWQQLELPYTCTETFEFIDGKDTLITLCDTMYTYADVSFENALTGYIALGYDEDKTYTGDNWGRVLKTNDGGITWTEVYSDYLFPFTSIQYSSQASALYITGSFNDPAYRPNQYIGVSTNGGSTWKNITVGSWSQISSDNPVVLFSVGANYLYTSKDNVVSSSINNVSYDHTIPANVSILSVWFIDSQKGFVSGINNQTQKGVTYSTVNGGISWTLVGLSTDQVNTSIYFTNEYIGYMTGNNGELYKTINSGGLGYMTAIAEEAEQLELEVYPNPASEKIILNSEFLILNLNTVVDVSIKSILGQNIFNSKFKIQNLELAIDVSQLKSGIYILQLQTEKGVYSKKFVKE